MNQDDFAKMLEDSLSASDNFEAGDRVEGTIVGFSPEYAFINISGKSEALIRIGELTDSSGTLAAKKGDTITAYIVSVRGGEVMLTSCIGRGEASPEILRTAYESEIPVEGRVTDVVKGGFSVSVSERKCFCPFSQIDIRPEPEEHYIGQTLSFRITSYAERGKNIILSRRILLEEDKRRKEEHLRSSLNIGDTVSGTISSVQSFGVFVDIGGVDALVPLPELSWARNPALSGFKKGGEVNALVTDIDWNNNRISLSIKKLQPAPWSQISSFSEGDTVKANVTNVIKSGAFAELAPGLEGFIHISRMSLTKKVTSSVVSAGEEISVKIINIDTANRKISLELVTDEGDPWQAHAGGLYDTVHTGVVEDLKPAGASIRLSNGMLGFAPKEKLAAKNVDIQKEFPQGREVKAVIVEMDNSRRKLILSVKDAEKMLEKKEFIEFSESHSSAPPTLGDLLKDKFAGLQKKADDV
ncbi:MAG: S1 RNA-binding domain-containing protein [Leptospirales bacterium]|nr:S1 RNA-binding domain-containing protein [Leptospirales bacterium]